MNVAELIGGKHVGFRYREPYLELDGPRWFEPDDVPLALHGPFRRAEELERRLDELAGIPTAP